MKIGQIVELAIWRDGTETQEQIKNFEDVVIPQEFAKVEKQHKCRLGPVHISVKDPLDDRVPTPPPHIAGPDVKLCVFETQVIDILPEIRKYHRPFVDGLDSKELARLRKKTREHAPHPLTDQQCDTIIEDLGPDIAGKMIVNAINS